MQITYKGDYALKALFALTLKYKEESDGILSIQEIAKLGDMPVKFLEQILLSLKKGGFVKSKRGINGGFSLARSPKDITVGSVVRFIDGPIGPIACVEHDRYKGCGDTASCIFREVWRDVKSAISVVVDTLTFEELAVRYKERKLPVKTQYEYII